MCVSGCYRRVFMAKRTVAQHCGFGSVIAENEEKSGEEETRRRERSLE